MKNVIALVILVLATLPINGFSTVIAFQCKSTELDGIHIFEANGVASIDEYNKVEGVLFLQIQKAQAKDSVQIFEEMKIEGTYQPLSQDVEQLTLFTNLPYIKSMNLILNSNKSMISQVFTIDNFLFRSHCSASEELK
ncbi:MAG: hypothetical protein KBD76_16455 [Bacteriovorax sp.]|nr:hypothetical protein [Bacteriovorax sp.]